MDQAKILLNEVRRVVTEHAAGVLATILLSIVAILAVSPTTHAIPDPNAVSLDASTLKWIESESVSVRDRHAQEQFALALATFALTSQAREDRSLKKRAVELVRARVCLAQVEGLAAPFTEAKIGNRLSENGLGDEVKSGLARVPIETLAVNAANSARACDF
ncbi:MAG: hypothetical protein E6R08_10280 [Nevskiaceae bacterium]|nr:MAG: hypothetical protein E6R08_10280 [Nevskiaceae bacterium]